MERIRVAGILVLCLFVFLALGIINLAGIHGRNYRRLSNNNCIRLVPQPGSRGRILDAKGRVLVESKLTYDIMTTPKEESRLNEIFNTVGLAVSVDPEGLRKEYRKNYFGPSVPVAIVRNVSLKEAIAVEVAKSDMPEVFIQQVPQRDYPYSRLASHVIGYINEIDRWRLTRLEDYGYKTKDLVGFGGVEEKYDYYLRQEEGGQSIEVDHRGRFIRVLGFESPKNGRDIQLTLDLDIQKIVEEKFSGRKGAVVIMDPASGEIVAMASGPDFDPSVFVKRNARAIKALFNNDDSPFINRAISAVYPAGSVFKVAVSTAALETKKINLSTTFLCTGATFVGRQEFKCWSIHGPQNIVAAIARSCNVFFYKTGLLAGAQAIHDYASKLGLGRSTNFELLNEKSGFIPSPLWRKSNRFSRWYDGDTANLSIGQGDVSVTPLQIVRMISVYANGGYLVNPYIVKSIGGRDISVYRRKIVNLSLRPETVTYIKKGLQEVISDPAGTGNVLSGVCVQVAGKTGTAQAPPGMAHAWFTGYFPANNPKYAICVLLEHGGPGYYSSVIARQIIEEMCRQGLL